MKTTLTLEERMTISEQFGNEELKLLSPRELDKMFPLTPAIEKTVYESRKAIREILLKKDKRKLVIIGPCSMQDVSEAKDLADMLKDFSERVKDSMLVLYRTYFQKPRTRTGWKGLIYDPYMDGTFDINNGLLLAREILAYTNEIGLASATEFLDRSIARRLRDLISWGAIGARTTESQDHRDWVSGYPMPVGFKNPTSGDIAIAVDACFAASVETLSIDEDNEGCTIYKHTNGNKDTHVVLRGGINGPNYDEENVRKTLDMLDKAKLHRNVIIDCSHGNSQKEYKRQIEVLRDIERQILKGNRDIIGIMMESNLEEGMYNKTLGGIQRGKSRTDACLGINESLYELEKFHKTLQSYNSNGNGRKH